MRDNRDDGRRPRGPRPFRAANDRPQARRRPSNQPADQAASDEASIETAATAPAEERIAKVIARAGIASRRDAEAMIEAGRVTLDGQPVLSPALNVGPDAAITVDGEPLPLRERTRLWLFHKPRGLVTTFRDPQGRPTVFEALPEEMPRVVAIGRLDINTEGLLLLTNDGGLAKVVAQPATGWTRRYRVRAHGEASQEQLDRLRGGVTVDGVEYGPVEAHLDRVQGDNSWLTLTLREGKNREVKRILEHLGLQVNRLLRLSFGPFQLGELETGMVEEVRTKVLREQLGQALAEEAGVDFASPVREPIAPFGASARPRATATAGRPARTPQPRRAGAFEAEARSRRPGGGRPAETKPRESEGRRPDRFRSRERVWSVEAEDDERSSRPKARRKDPKAERAAGAERPRERVAAIEAGGGQRVVVERIRTRPEEAEAPHRRARGRDRDDASGRGGGREATAGRGRADRGDRRDGNDGRGGERRGERAGRPPAAGRRESGREGFAGQDGQRPGRGGYGKSATGKTGGRPSFRDRSAGSEDGGGGRGRFGASGRSDGSDRPGGAGRPGGKRPGGANRPAGGGRPGGGRPGGGRPGGGGPGRGNR